MERQIFLIFPNYFLKILKLCGVFSHNIQNNGNKTNLLFSMFGIIICLIVQCSSVPAVKYFENLHEDSPIQVMPSDRGSILTKFVKCFYPIIMSTTPLVAILNTLWKCKPLLPQLLKHMNQSDEVLNNRSNFSLEQNKFAKVFITCCLGLSIPIKFLSVTTLVILHDVDNYLILFWVVFLYFADMVGFVTEIQFILMCNSLRIRFKEINNKLKSTFLPHDIKLEFRMRGFIKHWKGDRRKNNQESPKKLFIKKNKTLLEVNLKCSQDQTFLFNKSITHVPIFVMPFTNLTYKDNFGDYLTKDYACTLNKRVDIQTDDFSKQLKRLRLSYRHLSNALRQLKSMFEYVLLASVFTSFLLILLNVYFVIYGFVKIFILSNRFDVFFWILKSLCRFTGLLIMCDLTGKEATKTLEILGDYANLSLTKSTKEELSFFSREIASRQQFISCAFNLFVLKTTLITAAAAASTTYVVILVQLH